MALLASSRLFRAEAMQLDWGRVLDDQVRHLHEQHSPLSDKLMPTGEQMEAAKRRSRDLHIWWACNPRLGVPRGPFTVWARVPKDALTKVGTRTISAGSGEAPITAWHVEAALVELSVTPLDSGRPVRVTLHRLRGTLADVLAVAVLPAGIGPQKVRLRCSGATFARVDNATVSSARIRSLVDVVNDPGWDRIEVVGLPADQPWSVTDYDTRVQGFVHDPKPPWDAGVDRLVRGMPPLGWPSMTQTGRAAPPWVSPDPEALLKEVHEQLLPELVQLYSAGVPEWTQRTLEETRAVAGPSRDTSGGTQTSDLDTSAVIRPLSLLTLPAQTDPLLNLATGFGTTWTTETRLPLDGWPDIASRLDFMVTADYSRTPPPLRGKGTFAAYAPAVGPHTVTAPPTAMASERAGLVGPRQPNAPWRESIRVSWDALPSTVSFGRVSAGVLARYEQSSLTSECLAPVRDAGGFRPLTLSPDAPEGEPNHDRIAFVDAAADIPIGSGGRSVGYAATLVDIHGLWSAWRDVPYAGGEPAPQAPRVVSLTLESEFTGNPAACPSELRLEAAIDWSERTPAHLVGAALFYPMASAAALPPGGLDPDLATPLGCFRRDFELTFPSDAPTPSGCTVVSLSADGERAVTPGPGQGDGGRRYALTVPIASLDWTPTQRWGVQVWLRSHLSVGASPTPWVPQPPNPARAFAASPVPVTPLPPPAPPGVPLGSTIDAEGCSHVRVHWSLPAGAAVRTSIVWEVSETALIKHAGVLYTKPTVPPGSNAPPSPGLRLAALWAAYDAMSETARRAAFRRLAEVPGATTQHDVQLPKGSTDIHLFTVTTQTMTGIEPPWPGTGTATAHLHLQAAIAPRLSKPSPPVVYADPNDDGTVTLRFYSASRIPVARFLVFATRSEAAARDRESMGPAVASPVATAATGPKAATPSQNPTVDAVGRDPVTRSPMYEATWTGALGVSAWDPWLVRAVASPVDSLPVDGVRGQISDASDVVSVIVPPAGPPDLDVLTADIWDADHRGVVVRTSTSAPARATASGSHRIGATSGPGAGDVLLPAAFEGLAETPLTTAPGAASTGPVLERGVRSSGRSPVALWFKRPVATDPVDVAVRLIDPFGRATERRITVPGWVAPPPFTITISGSVSRPTGVLVSMTTDASSAAAAGIVLHVRALKRRFGPIFGPLGGVGGAGVGGPGIRPPIDRLRPLVIVASADFPLSGISTGLPFFPADGQVHVVRVRGLGGGRRYAVWVPVVAPLFVELGLESPDGQTATVNASV
ncbi:MAG TPA: hypothetical protein VFL38_15650 [Humibacillus xanthopallidus]|nr:hypothetical protein [Humibacillus xanthopallidus]